MNLDINTEIFNDIYIPFYNKKQRVQIYFGGSSSGKSYQIFSYAVLWMLEGRSIIIARQTLKSMRKSVWLELTKAIYRFKVQEYVEFNKTDMFIECKMGNGSITLVGLDDVERLKSLTPAKADSFDTCIIEEATEIQEYDFQQLMIRQRGRSPFPKRMILLFNPIFRNHWIYKQYFEGDWIDGKDTYIEQEDKLILKTTYKDNKFLGEEEKKTLEDMKRTSPYHYEVYCLGNFGTMGNKVYENFYVEPIEWENMGYETHIGLDFGFTNDPTAIVFSKYNKNDKIIYIYHVEYGYGWTNDVICEKLREAMNEYAPNSRVEIIADSAEPKSIQELLNNGFNVTPAYKGKDSIRKGIDFLQQHTMIVDPHCKEVVEEFNQYVWIERNGIVTNEPINKYNHCCDSLRYSYSRESSASGKIVFARMAF
jgi:phage terminase large subunit